MNFKKRVNGSWTDAPHYIHKTATDTITTLPDVIYVNNATATVGLKGQMEQTGTPTPTNPIQPQECGERTGNLCPDTGWRSGQYRNGVWEETNTRSTSDMFPVTSSQYRLKINVGQLISFINFNYFDSQKQWLGNRTTLGISSFLPTAQNIVIPQLPSNVAYMSITIRFYNDNGNPPIPQSFIDDSKIMVSEGTSEPSYEPYGYKIPISSANTTTNIYLGEVQTTRRIKKTEVEIERVVTLSNGNKGGVTKPFSEGSAKSGLGLCDKALYGNSSIVGGFYVNKDNAIFVGSPTDTLDDFKSKYDGASIWYVLAEPTTGIVNEPLRKIGDYADEVSDISIPTIAGANTLSVGTTLQPSEVTVNYKGWHPVADVHERDNGQWD